MKSSKIMGLAALYAAMIGMPSNPKKTREPMPERETPAERDARMKKAEVERNIANGLTEFFYGDKSLWALNKKSADKKAAKKGWI